MREQVQVKPGIIQVHNMGVANNTFYLHRLTTLFLGNWRPWGSSVHAIATGPLGKKLGYLDMSRFSWKAEGHRIKGY